jgi:signal transduction histidine kinase
MAASDTMGKRVLVVDDDAGSARALAELLHQDAGYATSVCTSGAEALRAIRERTPDAILLDVEMQGVSGLELLRTIRGQASPLALPILMVTAHHSGPETAAALRDGANDYVTKPVDLEVLLARLATQLHLAELARLKDEVLRMASHDLKNPLTAVILNARLLLDTKVGTPVDAEMHESARAILRRAAHMNRLVNAFLDEQAARDGRLHVELRPVSLATLAAQVAEEQRDYAQARGIEVTAGGEPAPALADAARLEQVLHNLVGNAIKFTPRGGRVELVTSTAGGRALVEVRDDGPGLGDDPERLFGAGIQGPARATGGERSTGLGLFIARLLVEAQGGTIHARHREGGPGASFQVALAPAPPGG